MFIVFEGPDRSGKSTLLEDVAQKLKFEGIEVKTTKEPRGKIREILLNEDLDSLTEALLFAADRSMHFKKLKKAKGTKKFVLLSDRYFESTVVYQNLLGTADPNALRALHGIATDGLVPDKTYFISSDEPHGDSEHKNDEGDFRDKQVICYKKLYEGNGRFKAMPWRYPVEFVDTTEGEWDDYLKEITDDIKEMMK